MAIELITGRAGAPHVDSADVGAFNAAMFGGGAYVIEGCEATLTDANHVLVSAGELLCEGRHIRITGAGETLTIDNGLSGYKRNDIIAMHYERDSSDIETCTLVVIKGNQDTGTPQDPPMPSSGKLLDGASSVYWPLYRIVIDDLTPQTPVFIAQRQALYQLGLGTEIPAGADLNDYVTPGVYKTVDSSVSNSLANRPTVPNGVSAGCVLTVELNGTNVIQTLVNTNTGLTFNRRKISAGWEDWTSDLSFTRFWSSQKRGITDMLQVDISASGMTADLNKPCFVQTGNASTLTNLPSFFAGYTKDFIAIRTVDWLANNRVLVTLTELYPESGRVWTNHYNWTAWDGWKCNGGIDSIVAEGTSGDWHWVKYANGWCKMDYRSAQISWSCNTASGSMYRTASDISLSFPFELARLNNCTVNASTIQSNMFVGFSGETVRNVSTFFYCPQSGSATNSRYRVHVEGWWK